MSVVLTKSQKDLLEASLGRLADTEEEVLNGRIFNRMFQVSPNLRALVAENSEEWPNIVDLMHDAFDHLDSPESFEGALQDHKEEYGFLLDQAEFLRGALSHALEITLGAEYTPDMERAWALFLTMIIERYSGSVYAPAGVTARFDPIAGAPVAGGPPARTLVEEEQHLGKGQLVIEDDEDPKHILSGTTGQSAQPGLTSVPTAEATTSEQRAKGQPENTEQTNPEKVTVTARPRAGGGTTSPTTAEGEKK
jgi:hypothetical protein